LRSRVRRFFLLSIALAGCAPKVERISMEPVIIRVDAAGESTVETPDPLLDELAELQETGKCDEAIPRLEKFLEDFPESLEEWERARGYHRWAAENAHFDLAYDAALHAAWCLEHLDQPVLAASEYGALADLTRAPYDARAIARLRQAIQLFRAGRTKKAHAALDQGIKLFSAVPDPPAALRTAAAEARFEAAEEKRREFSAIVLEYPQKRLDKRVNQKRTALLDAHTAYTNVVQIKDADWAAAAVCRVGEMFEELHAALIAVPPPPSLDGDQRAEYTAKVAVAAKVYLQQAFDSYVQVSALGERVGLESAWVSRARERMRALESQLKDSVVLPDDEPPDEEPLPSPPDEDPE
jgi:hypothetical protein